MMIRDREQVSVGYKSMRDDTVWRYSRRYADYILDSIRQKYVTANRANRLQCCNSLAR